jgi:hypothetical protein
MGLHPSTRKGARAGDPMRPTKVDEKRRCRHPDPERSEGEGPVFFVHPWRHFGTLTTFFDGAKKMRKNSKAFTTEDTEENQ